jgi:hypothetical protein
MKSIHIVGFEEKHIESASVLFAEQYKMLRNKVSCLPKKYENGNSISSLLKNLVQKSLGVAAIENDKLIGYLIGMRLSYFKGNQQAIYCPEWAHAINSTNSPDIYRKLYEKISMG